MHEKHLIDSLIHKILQLALEQKASKVTKVVVWLGALCHCSKEHFIEHFDLAAQGTLAQGALIEAEESTDPYDPHAGDILLRSIDVL